MMTTLARTFRRLAPAFGLMLVVAGTTAPLGAQQIETVDPDTVIDGDLAEPQAQPNSDYSVPDYGASAQELPPVSEPADASPAYPAAEAGQAPGPVVAAPAQQQPAQPWQGQPEQGEQVAASDTTYQEDDLIGAAEGVFGKGAEGLARLIEDILKKQGQPNGYIVGREGGGAFIFGVRYGSGTLHHKVEGTRPVYWTGPSIGFDAGANAGSTFVLVYNLYDTQDLYHRYPAGEGQAYFVGGFNASYMRKGDVVLIPIRVGAGLRLGVNAGYMKFSEKQRWLPF